MADPVVMLTGTELATALQLTYSGNTAAFDQVADAACAIVGALLTGTAASHATHPACREATLAVATDMWQARTAAGGQSVALDFTGGPYRLSVWLTRRVAALTAAHADPAGMVG
jgi:hypothetical protein